jgi:hypothetical protein
VKAFSAAQMAFKARVPYATAGRAFRDTLRRANAIQPRLGARDRAVLEAAFAVTTSYSKLQDFTTAREIACIAYGTDEIDGRDRDRVRESLNKLARLELIEITASGRGRGARVIVSVHPNETPLALVGNCDDDSGVAPVDFAITPLGPGRNTPRRATETPPASAAHLEAEKNLEKNLAIKNEVIRAAGPQYDQTSRYDMCPGCLMSTLACECSKDAG